MNGLHILVDERMPPGWIALFTAIFGPMHVSIPEQDVLERFTVKVERDVGFDVVLVRVGDS